MKFTIRNKRTTNPILTFNKKDWVNLLSSKDVDAFCLSWAAYRRTYKAMTNTEISLDHTQKSEFLKWVNADNYGCWKSKLTSEMDSVDYAVYISFVDGFRFQKDFSATMAVAERLVYMFTNARHK